MASRQPPVNPAALVRTQAFLNHFLPLLSKEDGLCPHAQKSRKGETVPSAGEDTVAPGG